MKRVALLFFACAFSLSACGGNRENLAEVGDGGVCLAEAESGSSGNNLAGEEREVELRDFLEGWSLKLDGGLEEYYGLLRKGAEGYAEEVAGEFQPVYDSNTDFPEELILRLEQALYRGPLTTGHMMNFFRNCQNWEGTLSAWPRRK